VNRALLKVQLVHHEGLRLKPYRDTVEKLTIGVGRNLDDVGISKEEAAALLDGDIDRTVAAIEAALPWFSSLDDARQRALVDMGFNLGVPGLLKFRDTLEHVRAGRYAEAAKEMLDSRWARQVGGRAIELSDMIRDGRDRWSSS
jgi:lysozyme